MDEVEAYMYNKLLPKMQDFAELHFKDRLGLRLPVPQGECQNFHCQDKLSKIEKIPDCRIVKNISNHSGSVWKVAKPFYSAFLSYSVPLLFPQ